MIDLLIVKESLENFLILIKIDQLIFLMIFFHKNSYKILLKVFN